MYGKCGDWSAFVHRWLLTECRVLPRAPNLANLISGIWKQRGSSISCQSQSRNITQAFSDWRASCDGFGADPSVTCIDCQGQYLPRDRSGRIYSSVLTLVFSSSLLQLYVLDDRDSHALTVSFYEPFCHVRSYIVVWRTGMNSTIPLAFYANQLAFANSILELS
jgi:hypothetical protein